MFKKESTKRIGPVAGFYSLKKKKKLVIVALLFLGVNIDRGSGEPFHL